MVELLETNNIETITNPVDLALSFSEDVHCTTELSDTEINHLLVMLDKLGKFMDGVYLGETSRALALPTNFEAEQAVNTILFDKLIFSGYFRTFSVVNIGQLAGRSSVNSLCLTFNEVNLLSYFDTLDELMLLHVPALAIDNLTRS